MNLQIRIKGFALLFTISAIFTFINNDGQASSKDGIKTSFKLQKGITKEDYLSNTVIVKIKSEYQPYCGSDQISIPSIQSVLDKINATTIERMFPHAKPPREKTNKYGFEYADLTQIYTVKYAENIPVEKAINSLHSCGFTEYVEPYYIYHHFYTPNDPSIGSQWHIASVKAYQAWNISKGDTNVVIGIIDSGIDIDHQDLVNDIKYNYADPIDGIDNDGDGYIDNFRGWDFQGDGTTEDNNPQIGGSDHGVHVSGCASPSTDNGVGVAGPGFNCKLLPVRTGDGTIPFGYQGITYAADHGADVINCSWGGPGGGQLGQDVIDYATINMDALVVAAAGNDATEDTFFPASYNHVLNVASTASDDTKSGFSNYGYQIDVCAPGSNIYSTGNGGGYYSSSGTSMASPVAAGCAALVKSHYGFLDAIQIGEQLRVTCDNIYPVNNAAYQNKLGNGRVNVYNALGGINEPSVVMTERNVSDGNDEAFVIGDTLTIGGEYINFLAPTGSITATLTASSSSVSIIDGNTSLGSLAAFGGTADNFSDPFLVKIMNNAQLNEKVTFELLLTDGSYSKTIFFQITVNVDYINVTINDVATSITSKSLIGFNDFSTQLEGLGFIYPYTNNGENLLFDGGLMVGIPNNVSDHVRGSGGAVDEDFMSTNNVQRLPTPVFSEFDLEGSFNDNNSSSPLNITVDHKAFAWSKAGHRKYVIVEYTINNQSSNTLSNLYAGIFTDWDIAMGNANGYLNNIATTDDSRYLGYTYNTTNNGLYAGVQVLTTDTAANDFIHYAIDNDGTNGSVDIYSDYLSSHKYTTLSTMRTNAGERDVSNVVSQGPFNVAAGSSIVVAFAVLAGDDLADIQETADSAWKEYNGFVLNDVTPIDTTGGPQPLSLSEKNSGTVLYPAFPNPNNGTATIQFNLEKNGNTSLEICNIMGKTVQVITSGNHSKGHHSYSVNTTNLSPGIYFYQLIQSETRITRKMTIIK